MNDLSTAWGNPAEWIGVLGTAGALAYAFWMGRRDRRERHTEIERAQASRVSAWERQTLEDENGVPVREAASETAEWNGLSERRRLYVLNASEAPIYDVIVDYFTGEIDRARGEFRPGRWQHAVVPPGQDARSIVVGLAPVNCGAMSEDRALQLTFRDAAGRWWRRGEDGNVRRASDLDHASQQQLTDRWMS